MTGHDEVHECANPLVMGVSGDELDAERILALGNPPEQMGVVFTADGDRYVAYYDSTENRWDALDFQGPLADGAVSGFAEVLLDATR